MARQGTAFVLGLDAPPASGPIVARLPKGMRANTKSRTKLCGRADAAHGTCPAESRIGSGRYVIDIAGFLNPGGQTQLTWSIDAFLGKPANKGDIASVVLLAKLLGADSVATLLTPELGMSVPVTATTTARLRPGLEVRLPGVPVQLSVPLPSTATPSRLELNLSAVHTTRENFVRRIKVPTLSGYEIRKVPDHRLVSHYLFRAPDRCTGSWPYELLAGGRRTSGRISCTATLL